MDPWCRCPMLRPSQTYEFIGFWAMDVTKPHKFIRFGSIHGPKPYNFIKFRWAFISQTPVVLPARKSGFRGGFRLESSRESFKIGPPAGLREVPEPPGTGSKETHTFCRAVLSGPASAARVYLVEIELKFALGGSHGSVVPVPYVTPIADL